MAHMSKPALISRYFRIGTSGPTVDGREISPQEIDDMAATYDPDVYTAAINLEHFNFLFPGFSFGQVVALKAEDGKDGKRVLLARIKPTSKLMDMNAAGQKIFTSMEIVKNFAKTGKAYLMGLAITDRPASLGVEALCFSASNGGPADERFKDNLFTPNFETETFTMADKDDANTAAPNDDATPPAGDETQEAPKQTFAQKFAAIFTPEKKESEGKFSDLEDASLTLAEKLSAVEKTAANTAKTLESMQATIDKLSAALENTPEETNQRPVVTGENENLTDC